MGEKANSENGRSMNPARTTDGFVSGGVRTECTTPGSAGMPVDEGGSP